MQAENRRWGMRQHTHGTSDILLKYRTSRLQELLAKRGSLYGFNDELCIDILDHIEGTPEEKNYSVAEKICSLLSDYVI